MMASLLVSGCGGNAESPDFGSSEDSSSPSPDQGTPSVGDNLTNEAWQQRLIYHIGPMDLPAKSGAEAMIDAPLTLRFQTDESIWVTGMIPRVVDASGGELPSTLLHTAMVANLHEENPFCASGTGGNPFFIASSMLTEVDFPEGYAYPILPTDPLEARVVFVNPTEQAYTGVTFELTLVTRPMNEFADLMDIKPMLVESDPCTHAPLSLEPDTVSERTATVALTIPGDIVVIQGVLQDYGSRLELGQDGAVEPFWSAEAELDDTYRLTQLSNNPLVGAGVAVKAGEALTMKAVYNNESSSWLKAATAAIMLYTTPNE